MEWTDEMIKQCPRPTGELGRIVGQEMNRWHYELWNWSLSFIADTQGAVILDIGCGGGGDIKLMAALLKPSKIYGIDISADMVALSQETNSKLVTEDLVEIKKGDVTALDFPADFFDLVTAFESYYFWPDLDENLKEIHRTLNPGGELLIVAEDYKTSPTEKKHSEDDILNLTYHTPDDFRSFLAKAGFRDIRIEENLEKKWIAALGKK